MGMGLDLKAAAEERDREEKLQAFIRELADRIFRAHEILGRRAERRAVVLTETDYCPLG